MSNFKHGFSRSKFYRAWQDMHYRCDGRKHQYYISRGIVVCKRWFSFLNFKKDMYVAYSEHVGIHGDTNTTLERIDNLANYSPQNCRWATKAEQQRNTSKSIFIAYEGFTLCISDWARKLGMSKRTIATRYHKGWSTDRIFSPVKV